MKLLLFAILLALLAGCTTTQEIRRPGGAVGYDIACGASTGWDICYKQANKVCPTGYDTLSQKGGFNRKELIISCPSQHIQPPSASSGLTTHSSGPSPAARAAEFGR